MIVATITLQELDVTDSANIFAIVEFLQNLRQLQQGVGHGCATGASILGRGGGLVGLVYVAVSPIPLPAIWDPRWGCGLEGR